MKELEFKIERQLSFRVRGQLKSGKLCIGGLQKDSRSERDSPWICFWSLSEIHPETGNIYGEDPLDALLNCVRFLINLIEKHKSNGIEVWWNREGDLARLTPVLNDDS